MQGGQGGLPGQRHRVGQGPPPHAVQAAAEQPRPGAPRPVASVRRQRPDAAAGRQPYLGAWAAFPPAALCRAVWGELPGSCPVLRERVALGPGALPGAGVCRPHGLCGLRPVPRCGPRGAANLQAPGHVPQTAGAPCAAAPCLAVLGLPLQARLPAGLASPRPGCQLLAAAPQFAGRKPAPPERRGARSGHTLRPQPGG